MQLELGQCTYMEEFEPFRYRPELAEPTQVVLKELLQGLLALGEATLQRLRSDDVALRQLLRVDSHNVRS